MLAMLTTVGDVSKADFDGEAHLHARMRRAGAGAAAVARTRSRSAQSPPPPNRHPSTHAPPRPPQTRTARFDEIDGSPDYYIAVAEGL